MSCMYELLEMSCHLNENEITQRHSLTPLSADFVCCKVKRKMSSIYFEHPSTSTGKAIAFFITLNSRLGEKSHLLTHSPEIKEQIKSNKQNKSLFKRTIVFILFKLIIYSTSLCRFSSIDSRRRVEDNVFALPI